MKTLGFDKPLYILPFDHRGSFELKMSGWEGALTAEIAAAKQVIYGGFVDIFENARAKISAA